MNTTIPSDAPASGKQGAGIALLALLGILTAFDSMSIDMYLPAFTAIQDALGLDPGTMQVSLSVFLLGLALGQGISGPLIDAYGRKTPLLVGIAVFGLASVMAMTAVNGEMLLAGRFLQGLGGATGLVIPRAIGGDLYDAKNATKIFTLLVQIQSISPILAPPLGGLLLNTWGWRSIFLVLVVFAAATFAATIVQVPETLPPENRIRLTWKNVFGVYGQLLGNRRYLLMTLSMGFIMATLFGYISGSSFVFMTYFGLSSTTYSILFAVNSVGMILAGQLNFVLIRKMPLKRHLALGFGIHVFFLLLFLGAVMADAAGVETVVVLLFLAMSTMGLLFGGITSEAMFSADPGVMGSASALLGVVQYALGGAAGIVLGYFHNGALGPYAVLLFVCAALAVGSWALGRRIPSPHGDAAPAIETGGH